jgi:hypothetical protein
MPVWVVVVVLDYIVVFEAAEVETNVSRTSGIDRL